MRTAAHNYDIVEQSKRPIRFKRRLRTGSMVLAPHEILYKIDGGVLFENEFSREIIVHAKDGEMLRWDFFDGYAEPWP